MRTENMDEINPYPAMTCYAVGSGLLDDTFTLIDVGCSGGIHPHWRVFGNQLRAFGFDPQQQECARLNQAENGSNVRYFPYFVGLEPEHEFHRKRRTQDPARSRYFNLGFDQLSAGLALECSQAVKPQSNPLNEDLTTQKISVARFVRENPVADVDFIKIDTDGSDLEVLISSEEVVRTGSVLGFMVESPYTGSDHEYDNSFHNIDRWMRRHGYCLYSLSVNRYSRRALPAPFKLTIAAQTETGQAIWGDALYLRNAASPAHEAVCGKLSFAKLLKLACLYEVFNLNDCAAELIQAQRAVFAGKTDPDHLLDLLTPMLNGASYSYADYMNVFRKEVSRFFPAANGSKAYSQSWRPRTMSSVVRGLLRRARAALAGGKG